VGVASFERGLLWWETLRQGELQNAAVGEFDRPARASKSGIAAVTTAIRSPGCSTRAERPPPLTPVPDGATDARFFRVVSSQGRDCLRLTAD